MKSVLDLLSYPKVATSVIWDWDIMDAISQTIFSSAFSWMKMIQFQWKFHWSLFLRVQLTIFQHLFRQWLGTDQATSHYQNHWWLFFWRIHDDVIKWTHFPRYWPFVRGIHRSPVNSPHKGQRRGALMFSLICVWINGWVNNREAGDLRRYRAHYDVIVMICVIRPQWVKFTHTVHLAHTPHIV